MASAPDDIKRLVETFSRNIDSFKVGGINETQLRREYLDPFFSSLGWDVENKQGYAEAYKEVIHEYSQKTKDVREAPDYCFRIGGMRKFFVEAKKPSVNVKDDIHPAYQLRSYAWSAKLPLSILTDFEEFAVYDCRMLPNKKDKASTARIMIVSFDEYISKWNEIEEIFARESILKGSFDKYVESNKKKKGTAEVDEVFLEQMEEWRKSLAKNIAIRNPKLNIRELNYAVQKIIDRIIFLRICEDRGIEDYGQLMTLQNGTNVFERLKQIYHRADEKYNSGLFHFEIEKERNEPPDGITLNLQIDDKTIKDIIKELYYPDSPYEFSVLPADILGQVYEQFLGKVIRLTSTHHAVVDDKPEVKKAGGVYYTPTYIVDYIVKNTLGKLLTPPVTKGRTKEGFPTPKDVSNIKILDPACGSGSFLLGAYQHLLDWHLKYYTSSEETIKQYSQMKRQPIYRNDRGIYLLTTSEKKRILLNNIYGVDIDQQAVEVTQLSLYLKLLEDETTATANDSWVMFKEQLLPDLNKNIVCGNSLIGTDILNPTSLLPFSKGEDEGGVDELKLKPMDFENVFPEIMKSGGFDAIVGNPPYGFRQIHTKVSKEYFKKRYSTVSGSFDNYFLFYECSLRLIKNNGLHGFIVPVTWLTIPSAKELRKFVLEKFGIVEINWLPERVFKEAQVNTVISIIRNSSKENVLVKIYQDRDEFGKPSQVYNLNKKTFIDNDYFIGIFSDTVDETILNKVKQKTVDLGTITKPCSGYNPYEVGKGIAPNGKPHTKETVLTKPYHSTNKINSEWKEEIIGRNLGRYSISNIGERWIRYGPWLAAARDHTNFVGKRILVQEITGGNEKRIVAAFYDGELYHSRDVIPIKILNDKPHHYYLLGIINSRLISWYHQKKNPKSKKSLFPKILVSDISKLPIKEIDFKNEAETKLHDDVVHLVDQILTTKKQLQQAKTESDKTYLQRKCETLDKQIDVLVYSLYSLTEEEIKIVEGG